MEIVWIYETDGYANLRFFSKSMGTQQRLPNGNTYIAEDNTGRLFQVQPDGEIVWEYMNRGGTMRPSVIPYDFTPQLRALSRPEELSVTPPNNLEWHITQPPHECQGHSMARDYPASLSLPRSVTSCQPPAVHY